MTTGIYSPTTNKSLGMAYVSTAFSAVDTQIRIRWKVRETAVVRRPLYVAAYWR